MPYNHLVIEGFHFQLYPQPSPFSICEGCSDFLEFLSPLTPCPWFYCLPSQPSSSCTLFYLFSISNSLPSCPSAAAVLPVSHFESCQPPAFSLPKPSSYRWVLPQLYRLSLQPGFQRWWLCVPSPVSVLTHAVGASPLLTLDVPPAPLSGGGHRTAPALPALAHPCLLSLGPFLKECCTHLWLYIPLFPPGPKPVSIWCFKSVILHLIFSPDSLLLDVSSHE